MSIEFQPLRTSDSDDYGEDEELHHEFGEIYDHGDDIFEVLETTHSTKGNIRNGIRRNYKYFCLLGVVMVIWAAIHIMIPLLKASKIKIALCENCLSAPTTLARDLPYLIYGTAWKESQTSELVKSAILNGYRFIDTANQPKHYNEEGSGDGWTEAVRELNLTRSEIYIQTKFSQNQDERSAPYNVSAPVSERVRDSVKSSLQHLKTNYLDALILHSPYSKIETTMEAWKAMESFVDDGKVLQLGISNCYKLETLSDLYDRSRIKPTILQNHLRTTEFDPKLLKFTRDHKMQYQAFWTLTANSNHLQKNEIKDFASAKGLSPQLYMYAFLLSIGITPLDGSKSHQIEDVDFIKRLQNKELVAFENEDEINLMANALEMKLI